jgi:hypothetical protein
MHTRLSFEIDVYSLSVTPQGTAEMKGKASAGLNHGGHRRSHAYEIALVVSSTQTCVAVLVRI